MTTAQVFERFAAQQAAGISPLYAHLAWMIAADPELLELAAHTESEQPQLNMLLGAVKYLLDDDPDDRLASFYDRQPPSPADLAGAGPAFAAFCRPGCVGANTEVPPPPLVERRASTGLFE